MKAQQVAVGSTLIPREISDGLQSQHYQVMTFKSTPNQVLGREAESGAAQISDVVSVIMDMDLIRCHLAQLPEAPLFWRGARNRPFATSCRKIPQSPALSASFLASNAFSHCCRLPSSTLGCQFKWSASHKGALFHWQDSHPLHVHDTQEVLELCVLHSKLMQSWSKLCDFQPSISTKTWEDAEPFSAASTKEWCCRYLITVSLGLQIRRDHAARFQRDDRSTGQLQISLQSDGPGVWHSEGRGKALLVSLESVTNVHFDALVMERNILCNPAVQVDKFNGATFDENKKNKTFEFRSNCCNGSFLLCGACFTQPKCVGSLCGRVWFVLLHFRSRTKTTRYQDGKAR